MRKVSEEEIEWIKENKEEFVREFLETLELTKTFAPQILHLKDKGNKEEYSKEFGRLLKIEKEKQKKNGREID